MVFEHLSDSMVCELYYDLFNKGWSQDDIFTEIYSIDCSMDEEE